MVAYLLLPPASTSSSLQYSLSLTEDDINSSFAVRWVLGVALGALMRNSVLIQALSAAAGGGQGKETSALRQPLSLRLGLWIRADVDPEHRRRDGLVAILAPLLRHI